MRLPINQASTLATEWPTQFDGDHAPRFWRGGEAQAANKLPGQAGSLGPVTGNSATFTAEIGPCSVMSTHCGLHKQRNPPAPKSCFWIAFKSKKSEYLPAMGACECMELQRSGPLGQGKAGQGLHVKTCSRRFTTIERTGGNHGFMQRESQCQRKVKVAMAQVSSQKVFGPANERIPVLLASVVDALNVTDRFNA